MEHWWVGDLGELSRCERTLTDVALDSGFSVPDGRLSKASKLSFTHGSASIPKSPAQHLSVLIHTHQIPAVTYRSTYLNLAGSFLSHPPIPSRQLTPSLLKGNPASVLQPPVM